MILYAVRWCFAFYHLYDDNRYGYRRRTPHRLVRVFKSRDSAEAFIAKSRETGAFPNEANPFIHWSRLQNFGNEKFDGYELLYNTCIGYMEETYGANQPDSQMGIFERKLPTLNAIMSLTEDAFFGLLKELMLEPPKVEMPTARLRALPPDHPAATYEFRDWFMWWEKTSMTDVQRRRIWKAMDRLTFYEIVEMPLGEA